MARGKHKPEAGPPNAERSGWGDPARLAVAVVCVALGTGLCAASLQSILESRLSAESLLSAGLWEWSVRIVGGRLTSTGGALSAEVSFAAVLPTVSLPSLAAWLLGAWWISRRRGMTFRIALARWGACGWAWALLAGSWEVFCLAAFSTGAETGYQFLRSVPVLWITIGLGGWLATFWTLENAGAARFGGSPDSTPSAGAPPRDDFRVAAAVWLCCAAYVACFTGMNWQLYRGLLLPHGDSAMYEEHLWNLLHGKGFRSYLDQGLFLGEHVQVIHLFLIPLYVLWPSQMMLELCGSAILAAGSIPVYWMARRHTGSAQAGVWMAAGYLLYFPMQFLDIAIDLKTFRPNGFGIPILLFALDQLERGRYKSFGLLLLFTLCAQEDYALVLAPLGVWIAVRQARVAFTNGRVPHAAESRSNGSPAWRKTALWGIGVAVFAAAYLLVATRLIIPWFRNWQEIHYARYFAKFGNTLTEIGWNILTNPKLLFQELVTPSTAAYVLVVLAPLGFLPLFSPGRLLVAFPLLVTLCLNELAVDPRHHFHAPLVPIVFWSAAAGLAAAARGTKRLAGRLPPGEDDAVPAGRAAAWWARFACFAAMVSGAFFGISPMSIAFWDPHSHYYWRALYVPTKRAEMFARVLEEVPRNARVASTDFIHPRFTHFARSYDYSDYPRAVNGNRPGAPPDTDYIVIDTRHEYSKVTRPDQVREYREHPDAWELLPDNTQGYFIVLKRKQPAVRR